MKDFTMFNPMVTIITLIPKWLHQPHRFECLRIFSQMLYQEERSSSCLSKMAHRKVDRSCSVLETLFLELGSIVAGDLY